LNRDARRDTVLHRLHPGRGWEGGKFGGGRVIKTKGEKFTAVDGMVFRYNGQSWEEDEEENKRRMQKIYDDNDDENYDDDEDYFYDDDEGLR